MPVIPPPTWEQAAGRFVTMASINAALIRDAYLKDLVLVDFNGVPYDDAWYTTHIYAAISTIEHETGISIYAETVNAELHDYYVSDYVNFCRIQLFKYPIIADADTPVVMAKYPTGQELITFPRDWVHVDQEHGVVELVPTVGSLSNVILGQGGNYLPVVYSSIQRLPQLFHVTYKAGFAADKVPTFIRDAIAKMTCVNVLRVAGDSINPPGITNGSISIDGLSQSRGYQNNQEWAPAFSGRINQYRRELYGDPRAGSRGLINVIQDFYRAFNMVVA